MGCCNCSFTIQFYMPSYNDLAANYLYKLFSDKMNTPPPTIPVYANTQNALNIPNDQQPGLFPNNTGSVPPMGNNVAYPVPVQQTGPNNNQ